MRINLNTPFAEKDEAKALGARWDGTRKCWYIQNVADLSPFQKWIKPDTAPKPSPHPGKVNISDRPVITGPASVPHCGCDVLPWEPCEHSARV
jgi:Domain of unknown function (DUF5710)